MTAAEFIQELERRGKWEVEVAFEVEDANETPVGSEWHTVTVDCVQADRFITLDGDEIEFGDDHWRFPGKPKPDFLTWARMRAERLKAKGGYLRRYLLRYIDDYEAGHEP